MGFLSYGSWIVKVRPTSYPMVKVLPWMIRLNRLKVCEKHLKTSRMQSLEGHISWDNFTRLLSLSMQSKLERDICHIPMKRTESGILCSKFLWGKEQKKGWCIIWENELFVLIIRRVVLFDQEQFWRKILLWGISKVFVLCYPQILCLAKYSSRAFIITTSVLSQLELDSFHL